MQMHQLFTHSKPLGEILVEMGYLTTTNLRKALNFQKRLKRKGRTIPLGKILAKKKLITPGQLQEANACHYNLGFVSEKSLENSVTQYLEPEFCVSHKIIPIDLSEKIIHIAIANPFNFKAFAEISKHSKKAVKVSLI